MNNRLKIQVGSKFVCNEFRSKQLRDTQYFSTRATEQEGDGVEDIPDNQLEGKMVNTKPSSNPGQEPIDTGK